MYNNPYNRTFLKMCGLVKILAKNINQKHKTRNLELLAIKPNINQDNKYDINLIFSGNSIMLLKAEEIDVMVDDQEYYWNVKHIPKHHL